MKRVFHYGYSYSQDFVGTLQVFQLPKALAYPLFYKLVAPNSSTVTRDAILSWFEEKNVVQVWTLSPCAIMRPAYQ